MTKKKSRSFRRKNFQSSKKNKEKKGAKKKHFGKTKKIKTLTGIVKRHPDGFGFLLPEEKHPDVYLPPREMQGILNQDKVLIAVTENKRQRDFFSGRVLRMIKRAQDFVIGPYTPLSSKSGQIKDSSFQWGEDLKVNIKTASSLQKGEWIQVKITHWPGSLKGFCGDFISSLGVFPKALEDSMRVAREHHIPVVFSTECLKEAEALPETLHSKHLSNRKDLRKLSFVTIDGKTAKDFDDAIYIRFCEKSGWTLYVAIADVSYYVKTNSALDKTAYERGNSSYFPNLTFPMLPAKLSENLCSLKPNEDKLTLTAELHFDLTGKQTKALFYESIIRSKARLTYGKTQEILDKKTYSNSEVLKSLLAGRELTKILRQNRSKKYFVDLDIPETEVILNSLGEPLDIIQTPRLFSHKLIEECMLAANQAVAKYLHTQKIPSLYRSHDPPPANALKSIESFVQNQGLKIQFKNLDLQKKLSLILKQFKELPLSPIIQTMVLRSLSQALYSADKRGHFGLNMENYTHFTSPIRRYNDLLIHRILKTALDKKTPPYSQSKLQSKAKIMSACEQRSVKAERQIKDIKKARFLKKHLGEKMEGMISSVVRFGFFVKLKLYDIEGLVHIKNLKGTWQFVESLLELKAKSSGQKFKMGDLVLIQVTASNIETGQIDFALLKHKKR